MTLVEMMIAASIATIVLAVGLRFVIQTLKSYQYETGKLLINRDIRKFTAQMIDDGTYANGFMIFDQASNLSRTGYSAVGSSDPTSSTYKGYSAALTTVDPADPVDATQPGTSKVESGMPGDVLVFIYYVNGDNTRISQLIVYYRWISTTPNGTDGTNNTNVSTRTTALKRLVCKIYDDGTTNTTTNPIYAGIMKLLPGLTATTNSQTLFPYVDGQASDITPTGSVNRTNKLFYNSNNNSVLIRGRIYENYTAQRLIKSTYTFTITPRG